VKKTRAFQQNDKKPNIQPGPIFDLHIYIDTYGSLYIVNAIKTQKISIDLTNLFSKFVPHIKG